MHNRFQSKAASAGLVLGLLVLPLSTAVSHSVDLAQAAGSQYLTMDRFSGYPGTSVMVSGGGFTPSEALTLTVAGANGIGTMSDASGNFGPVSVNLPANLPQGAAVIAITNAGGTESASNSYYVQPYMPGLSLSTSSTSPYASVTVGGSGFAPGEMVSLSLESQTAQAMADSMGTVSGVALTIPNVPSGTYLVHGVGQSSGATAVAYLYVGGFYPSTYPSSYYLLPDQTLSFSGGGFAPGETVNVTEGTAATLVSTFTVGTDGTFKNAGSITIPSSYAGQQKSFTLTGQLSGATAGASVAVGQYYPQVSPSVYYVMPGGSVSFSGSSFAPNESVAVTADKDATVLATITTDEYGMFSEQGAMTIPYSYTAGSHVFHFAGSHSLATGDATITVGQLYPTISPSSYYIRPGESFSVATSGFAPGEKVDLTMGTTTLGSVTADEDGAATFSDMVFPTSTMPTLTLTATGESTTASVSATVTVGQYYPYATANNYYVLPGSVVTVSGYNFAPGETVTVSAGTFSTTATADKYGNTGDVDVTLPFGGTAASGTVTLTGSISNAVATLPLTLAPYTPSVSPDTYYATPGTVVNFTGSGFVPGETVAVTLNKADLPSVTADTKGNLTTSATLPFNATSADFTFTGATSGGVSTISIGLASFYPGLSLDNYYAVGGTSITLSGSGFVPKETVRLMFGDTDLGFVNAADGTFVFTTTVPYAQAGDKKVTAFGGTSHATATTTFTQAPVYVSLQLGAYAGAPGEAVTFVGSGYLPGETVDITTDRTSGVVYTLKADATGSFNDSGYVLPAGTTPGQLSLTATGEHSLTAQTIVYYVTGA